MSTPIERASLQNKIAVVTGGSRGIGRATAFLLGAMGATVVVNYVSNEVAANEVVNAIEEKGSAAIAVRADISELKGAEMLIKSTVDQFGRVDLLICCAGIWEGAPIENQPEELWRRTLDINLGGTWSVCHEAVPIMKSQRFGRIVVVSSTAGQRGEANYSNYAASKAGQIAFVKSLAAELGEWGITVNAVAPGWVDTDMTVDALGDADRRQRIAAEIPVRNIATPQDIAGPIAFLCTDWARHINGEVLNVNGGSVLCG